MCFLPQPIPTFYTGFSYFLWWTSTSVYLCTSARSMQVLSDLCVHLPAANAICVHLPDASAICVYICVHLLGASASTVCRPTFRTFWQKDLCNGRAETSKLWWNGHAACSRPKAKPHGALSKRTCNLQRQLWLAANDVPSEQNQLLISARAFRTCSRNNFSGGRPQHVRLQPWVCWSPWP